MPGPADWPALGPYFAWLEPRVAATTARQRRYQLQRFARHHPAGPWSVALADVEAWIAGREADETRRSELAALRGFYDWAVKHRAAPLDDQAWRDPTADAPRIRVPQGRVMPCPAEAFWTAEGLARDDEALMLLLAAHCGLRCAEIAAASTDDIAPGAMLRIRGKGRKVRLLPLTPALTTLFADRLATSPGALFPGRREGTHLRPGTVSDRLARLLPDAWTAHTLRHAFATNAYAATGDIVAVQELLGHSSPVTTRRYIAAVPESVRLAAAGAAEHLPSRGRLAMAVRSSRQLNT
jgi:integrase